MARLTPTELADLAERIARGVVGVDDALGSLDPDDEFARTNLVALAAYCVAYRERRVRRARQGPAQARARRLLRDLLSPDERAQLARSRQFVHVAASGNAYRFYPNSGGVSLIVRRGARWFMRGHYCFHEAHEADEPGLPPADQTIGQYLLVRADEGRFLAEANWRASQAWAGRR